MKMGQLRIRKRKAWTRTGVSEVVGNLLILAITVTLFSGIMFYVVNMPTPTEQTYGDFYGSVEFTDDGGYINLTHLSGEALQASWTHVYILLDGHPTTYGLSDSATSIGDEWNIGEKFERYAPGIGTNTSIEVRISNVESNTSIWNTELNGNGGDNGPVITDRWVEKVEDDIGTRTTSMYIGDSYRVYADIVDLDRDIDVTSVSVDLSSIGGGTVYLDGSRAGGEFTDGVTHTVATTSPGAKSLVFNVVDANGNTFTGYLSVSVTEETGGGDGGDSSDENGSAPIGPDYSMGQGFAIYERQDWLVNGFGATPTKYFEQDEDIEVIIVSSTLVNIDKENVLDVINPMGKVPVSGALKSPIQPYSYIDGFHVYNGTIDGLELTEQDMGMFNIYISLEDTWSPSHTFVTTDTIFINNMETPVLFETYSDPSRTDEYECDTFDTNDIIYVKVTTKQSGTWDRLGGDVEIRDYEWNPKLKKMPSSTAETPGTDYVVNKVVQQGGSNVYYFDINVERIDFTQSISSMLWIPGDNAYTLQYNMFKTSSEEYLLSKIITIQAPYETNDIVIGTLDASGGSGWRWLFSSSSQTNPILYYSHDTHWTEATVVEEATGRTYEYLSQFVEAADLDMDSDPEIIASLMTIDDTWWWGSDTLATQFCIFWNDGTWKQEVLHEDTTTVRYNDPENVWMVSTAAIGNIDNDDDNDVVAVLEQYSVYKDSWRSSLSYENLQMNPTGNVKLVLYRNDGDWTDGYEEILTNSDIGVSNKEFRNLMLVNVGGLTGSNFENRSMDIVFNVGSQVVTVLNNGGTGDFTEDDRFVLNSNGKVPYFLTASSGNLTQDNGLFQDPTQYLGEVTNGDYTYTKTENLQYLRLEETMGYHNDTITPSALDPALSQPDWTPQFLSPETDNFIEVESGETLKVDAWAGLTDDSWNLYQVFVNVNYSTTNYLGGAYIEYSTDDGSTWMTLMEVSSITGDTLTTISILTSGLNGTDVENIQLRFSNTVGGVVRFSAMYMDVVQEEGYGLDYVWAMNYQDIMTSGTLICKASVGGSVLEPFEISYSLTHDGPWSTLMEFTNTGTTRLTTDISGFSTDTIYFRVSNSTTSYNQGSIRIYYLALSFEVDVTVVGTEIYSMNVFDMDQDNYNDLIIASYSSQTGKHYVKIAYNDGYGNLYSNIQAEYTGSGETVMRKLEAGNLVDGNGPDIAILRDARVDFLVNQGGGMYSMDDNTGIDATKTTLSDMQIFDIDGDGDSDILVSDTSTTYSWGWFWSSTSTTSDLILWRHYLNGWESIVLDSMDGEIYSISVADIEISI